MDSWLVIVPRESSSGFHSNICTDIEVANRTEQYAGSPLYSGPRDGKCVKGNLSSYSDTGDSQMDEIYCIFGTQNSCKDSDQKVEQVNDCLGVEVTKDSEVTSAPNTLFNDSQDKQDRYCLVENENPSDVRNALDAQDGGVIVSDEKNIINGRENLKETDEYKRAIQEEWASRQQQLQIQAEKARRLRKRKKTESKRLLDMQKRQKERIEEVRETQRKDKEFVNMKEQLRIEIRKEIKNLEMTCIDMASLLRGLGIQIQGGGGFNSLPNDNEVRTAYKRTLLKFHPDRALKTDIRDQVEAEEKFKLISRMKEKFLWT